MARVGDLNKLIQRQAFDDQHRTLILVDEVNGGMVWCKFVCDYDQSQLNKIDLLFDSTFRELTKAGESIVFTYNVLPMVGNIGRHQITIVTHTRNGCSVENADPSSIHGSIGIDR